MSLERQDDKINNLSRALKMYGKPLMEIANQGADVAAQVAEVKKDLTQLGKSTAESLQLVMTATEEIDATVDLKPLQELTGKLADDVRRNIREVGDKIPDTSALTQQLVRLEANVQALGQRQDDGEMRKSLVRLEDFSKVQTKKLEDLAKAEAISSETQRLEQQLDKAIGKIGSSIGQMREQDISTLDSGLRDLQRELAGIATTTAYIQQAVKSGGGVAAAPAPAAKAPSGKKRGGSGDASSSKPAASKDAVDADGNAYSTGKRASSGKNVLGAIAKLKNMKK